MHMVPSANVSGKSWLGTTLLATDFVDNSKAIGSGAEGHVHFHACGIAIGGGVVGDHNNGLRGCQLAPRGRSHHYLDPQQQGYELLLANIDVTCMALITCHAYAPIVHTRVLGV